MPATARQASTLRLRKVLILWDLIFYGMVLIQPVAGIPLAYRVSDWLGDAAGLFCSRSSMLSGEMLLSLQIVCYRYLHSAPFWRYA